VDNFELFDEPDPVEHERLSQLVKDVINSFSNDDQEQEFVSAVDSVASEAGSSAIDVTAAVTDENEDSEMGSAANEAGSSAIEVTAAVIDESEDSDVVSEQNTISKTEKESILTKLG